MIDVYHCPKCSRLLKCEGVVGIKRESEPHREPVDHRTLGVSNPYCELCTLVFTGAEWERS